LLQLPPVAKNLERYQRKRDFAVTPEPRGKAARRAGPRLQYVVQKHDARRLHYDLRLEHDGVLKSWAVPKEPSFDPKDRRLAVQTEDHPLEYADFEGEIPEHEYGAGSVVIWDRGHWTPLGDPTKGLAEGKLDFELEGGRLAGRWTLVRMAERSGKREKKDNWLLIKRSDRGKQDARRAAAKRPRRKEARDLEHTEGAKRAPLPESPRPQLATAVTRPPEGFDWLHEPKLDGYRLLCRIDDGHVALLTRRGNDWTPRFGAIAEAAARLPCRAAVLDGEAVVFDARGRTSFQQLQNAIAANDPSIVLVAFDLLHLDGWDLRGTPLRERKALLAELLAEAPDAIRYGEHVEGNGGAFFREACRLGLEGIVSKRATDRYREERTKSWLKAKCLKRQEFVIVGYTDPAGSRSGFGALLVGVRKRPGEPLRYAGRVGTGFDERTLRALAARLEPLERRTPPVTAQSARGAGRGVHWVEPTLVAEVAFAEWTGDGRLRHPTFRGLREDKAAEEVVEEREMPTEAAGARPAAQPRKVKLTNPDKVLFPDPGITKRQLARYWEDVAETALPYLRNRPLTLLRCPDGHDAQCFYQKHVGAGVPDAVPRVTIREDEEPYAMVDGPEALRGLVQIGVLELHVWGSRAEHLDQPDIVVFDLDPAEGLPWHAVAVGEGFGPTFAAQGSAFLLADSIKAVITAIGVTACWSWARRAEREELRRNPDVL